MTSAPELRAAPPASYDRLIRDCGLPRLEARALMERASERRREWLIAHGEDPVPEAIAAAFATLARRRRDGEPVAYLVGEREFHGHRFRVDPSVLIPRPDTETLVDWAIELAAPGARVLDLGTGSGAIAVSLALARTDLVVWATDRSAAALERARDNAARLLGTERGGSDAICWRLGAWWKAIAEDERFDVVVANPPYIDGDDPHLAQGDLRFEPREALTPGPDGMAAIAELVAGAPGYLAEGAWLLLEHGLEQGAAVRARLEEAGFAAVLTRRDAAGHERVSGGCWRGGAYRNVGSGGRERAISPDPAASAEAVAATASGGTRLTAPASHS